MIRVPSGTELARPFLPTKDFDLSRLFYEALGFEKTLDGEVAIFAAGSGGFILQRYYHPEWAANCMMQLMVDDLTAWWAHIESLDLPGASGFRRPSRPPRSPGGCRSLTSSIPPESCGTSPSGVWGRSRTDEFAEPPRGRIPSDPT